MQAVDIKQGATPPSGCKQQAPHASLAEKCVGKLSVEVFEQRMHTPVHQGDHIPSTAAMSGTMQLGNQVRTHRRAAPNTELLIMLDAGFLPWACPQRLDSCTVPVLDIRRSPGWYQCVWNSADPAERTWCT